ncbi:MAG: tetratricopeptide repeat protein [Campylobacterales bacterium]
MKVKFKFIAVSLIASTLLYADTPAKDKTVQEAIDNYRNKQFSKSYNLFNEAISRYGQNPQLFFYYGRSALETKRYEQAIEAFEKVLILNPSHTRTKLELARAYYEIGQYDEAKRLLESAQSDPALPAKVKKSVKNLLTNISMKKKESIINGFAMIGVNYDSNVYAGNEDDFGVFIPAVGNIQLEGSKAQEDYYNSNIIGLNHIKDIGEVGSWVWKSNGILLNNNYRRYTDKNLFGIVLTTGPSYFGKDYELYFPFSVSKIWQGGSSYVNDISQGVRWTRRVDETFTFSAGYKFSKAFYTQEQNNNNDNAQHAFTMSATKFFTPKWNVALGAKLASSKATRNDTGQTGNDEKEGSINTTYQATDNLSFTVGALFRNKSYNVADTLYGYGTQRDDNYQSYSLSTLYSLSDSSSIKASVADMQNHSNQGAFDYDKTTVGINYILTF